MRNIHVILQDKRKAIVLEDPEAVMQNDYIYWHFYADGTAIRKVKIIFDKADATFFPTDGKVQNWIEKDLQKGTTVWGRAPAYFPPTAPPSSRPDKYTVEAYGAGGQLLDWATRDPTIKTDGP